MGLTKQQWMAVLIVGGVIVILIAAGVPLWRYYASRRPAPTAEATPTEEAVATVTAPETLSPTAAAVATQLPTVTPIATAGAPASRPSAPVRIEALQVGISAPVVEVGWHVAQVNGEPRAVWETVGNAAAHHRGSADPGELGNCVISAHSSDEGGAVFKRLGELVAGDMVDVIAADGVRYTYEVTSVQTLEETGATDEEKREHGRLMDPTEEPVLTLITCWPDWSYTQRIVVRCELAWAE